MKLARAARDYGLPRLTVAEAARILGITPTAFTDWIADYVKPTMNQWSNWRAEDGPGLPEALIRLYLTHRASALTVTILSREGEPITDPPPEALSSPPLAQAVGGEQRLSLGADQRRRRKRK